MFIMAAMLLIWIRIKAGSFGTMLSPALVGLMLASGRPTPWPFIVGGGLKITYDLTLLYGFGREGAGQSATSPGASATAR